MRRAFAEPSRRGLLAQAGLPVIGDQAMASVDFFYGTGSRYSYLAATQIAAIERAGAGVRWRAVYSPELIRRAGSDPFAQDMVRGQYDAAYRTRDAKRWASLLRVPYAEPDFAATDWRRIALWAAAAELLGAGAAFGAAALQAAFARGAPPRSEEELAGLAQGAGLAAAAITGLLASGAAAEAHEQNLQAALSAGGFGVPTFVVDDGEVFWGQDRIPLLLHHLTRRQGPE